MESNEINVINGNKKEEENKIDEIEYINEFVVGYIDGIFENIINNNKIENLIEEPQKEDIESEEKGENEKSPEEKNNENENNNDNIEYKPEEEIKQNKNEEINNIVKNNDEEKIINTEKNETIKEEEKKEIINEEQKNGNPETNKENKKEKNINNKIEKKKTIQKDITKEENKVKKENKSNKKKVDKKQENKKTITNSIINKKENKTTKEDTYQSLKKKTSETNKKQNKSKKKPKIIDKSKNTTIKNTTNTNNTKINNIDDKIYSHNHFHNENIKNYIKQKESKEIEECSFKPKINKKIGFEINSSDNNGLEKEKDNQGDVVERLFQWKERVQKKKNDTKNKNMETVQNGCTFNPKLNSEMPKFENTKINGTKKYLERIKNSREIQKQKEEKLNLNYNQLYNKYYKKKEKTVLDKNKKLTKKEYENYLSVFHNALMNDDE